MFTSNNNQVNRLPHPTLSFISPVSFTDDDQAISNDFPLWQVMIYVNLALLFIVSVGIAFYVRYKRSKVKRGSSAQLRYARNFPMFQNMKVGKGPGMAFPDFITKLRAIEFLADESKWYAGYFEQCTVFYYHITVFLFCFVF